MKIRIAALAAVLVLMSSVAAAAASGDRVVFAVVMSRHGVRSFTHAPPEYSWPDWAPVAPGFLTGHGYRLIAEMGGFYRRAFAAEGLVMACRDGDPFVYADLDQRTLATGQAFIEGACGAQSAVPLYHDRDLAAGYDPLFDGADWLVQAGKIDAVSSLAAVSAAVPKPPSLLVERQAPEFAALQALLDPRCSGACAPVASGTGSISAKKGLAQLTGPVDTASEYAESLFLQYAQCGPQLDTAKLAAAMRLHVLEYQINARNAYTPLVKGGNMFAHIVGLLEEKAGLPHPGVNVPDVHGAHVAIIAGHDTQLGAIGGILDAHWPLGGGMTGDDNPPGGALVFELLRSGDEYRVRVRFGYETLDQYRRASPVDGGAAFSPVHFAGCAGDDCSVPLATFAATSQQLIAKGFVQADWTPMSDAPPQLAPLADPPWTACLP
jgi:4-phytase/acid phosphatase